MSLPAVAAASAGTGRGTSRLRAPAGGRVDRRHEDRRIGRPILAGSESRPPGPVTGERRIALACAAIALATTGAAVAAALAAREWSPSALVHMSATEPIARLARDADSGFHFVPPGAHYDGVYFYAIARDPFARGDAHTLIDGSAYRYGHAGYGWLAGIVSLGRAELVPSALLAINLVAVAVAAFAASALARDYGWSPWGGVVVAVNPGTIFAATVDTSEALGVAMVI